VDDIQKELDKVSSTNQVDNELAALKAEIGTGSGTDGTAALPAAEAAAAHDAEEVPDVKEATGGSVGTGGESA